MAIQNYLDTLKKARATGTPGNYAKANTRIPANMQNGVPVYEKQYRGQTMYAPEIFDTARDRESLAKFKTLTPPATKPANELGGNVIKFGGDFDSNLTKTDPAKDLASTFGMMNINNSATNTNTNTTPAPAPAPTVPTPTPVQEVTTPDNTYLNDLNNSIKTLEDAINQRYESMKVQARDISGLNQSNIRGNLGRVFGNNVDTSEAAPVTTENKALEGRLREIDIARNEAIANNNLGALDRLQAEQARIQSTEAAQRQQDFNNAVAQAALTGNYGGVKTLDAQQQDLQRSLQEAGLLGTYNGTPTLQGMSTLSDIQTQELQRALQEAGITGMYKNNPTLDAITSMSGITGYYGGQPTLSRDQLSLNTQNKQINDILDYISSTQNNLNTNQTKMSLADVNNQADLEQLLKRLSSQEGIASLNNSTRYNIADMNNSTKYDIANLNNSARASLLREKVASGTANSGEMTENQAYTNLTKALEINSVFPGTVSDQTIKDLQAKIDSYQKKKSPVAEAPSGQLGFLDFLASSMGLG